MVVPWLEPLVTINLHSCGSNAHKDPASHMPFESGMDVFLTMYGQTLTFVIEINMPNIFDV